MTQTIAVWLVILLAAVLANGPFLSQRFLGVYRLRTGKSKALQALELVIAYLLVGAVARSLEQYLGQVAPQGWAFYAVTAALFVTLAFPGFVYRYLLKR